MTTPTLPPPVWPRDWLAPRGGAVRVRWGAVLGAGPLMPPPAANRPAHPRSPS